MDRSPESLDDRLLRALRWTLPGLRFAWAHVETLILIAVTALALGTLWRHRLRIAAEAGAMRGAYERERARELQRARDYGQAVRPPSPPPDAAPAPAE